MKTPTLVTLLACLALHAQSENIANLEVHEWGTLTVLCGSDGVPLNWYQAPGTADALPSFVQVNPSGMKNAPSVQGALVRMETPVIYFYPEESMHVSAAVAFQNGQITEWFPNAVHEVGMAIPKLPLTWEGELLPPTDKKAQMQIPAVLAGKGDHYRHAREVPGAWIFRSSTAAPRADNDPAKGKDADKFIFYRGRGDSAPPLRVQADADGSVRLRRLGSNDEVPASFALTVKEGTAHWTRLPKLRTATDDPATIEVRATLRTDDAGAPIEKAADELSAAMREALVTSGLTKDEARAMVATWDGHWFREPGTRVLAILPRAWVDSVLPLTIQPAPTKLTRVFVARFEVLTPQREAEVLALLNEPANDAAKVARLKALELGRFARGALARAQAMQNQRMSQQFEVLQQAALNSPLNCRTTAWAQ